MSERVNPWVEDVTGAVAVAEWQAAGDHTLLSPRGQEFWEENQPLAEMQSFDDLLADVEAHPEDYQHTIRSKPVQITIGGIDASERTKYRITEAEAVIEMASYLDHAEEMTRLYPDVRIEHGNAVYTDADQVRLDVSEFRRNLNFMSSKEYEAACKGMAELWVEYVGQGDDYTLNVWSEGTSNSSENRKSWQKISRDIYAQVTGLVAERPELLNQVKMKADEWADSAHAKVVFVDDWILSGDTVRKNLTDIRSKLKEKNLERLADSVEVHTLWSVTDQIGQLPVYEGGDDTYLKRTYYSEYHESDADDRFVDYPHVSGSHSSVDHGFETDLRDINRFLIACEPKRPHEMPMLYKIDREYRPTVEPGSLAEQAIEEVASTNAQLQAIQLEINGLQEAAALTSSDNSVEQQQLEDALIRLDKERVAISLARVKALEIYYGAQR